MKSKYQVAVIGATGMAGQQFMEALINHPWFEIFSIHGHSSVGSKFGNSIRGFTNFEYSEDIKQMKVQDTKDLDLKAIDIVFSAIPSSQAKKIEGEIAKEVPVISTASAYRYEEDVPIYLPIVNGEHYKMLDLQKRNREWNGFVLPGPNCTTVGLSISLYPIYQKYGIESVHMTSMQAISGAGYPGVAAYDIVANVIPYIKGEEEKVVKETKKILGTVEETRFIPAQFTIDCKCNRVPSINGHMESVFVQTKREFESIQEIKEIFKNFKGQTSNLDLPNAPKVPIQIFEDPYRPQPRIDLSERKNTKQGMRTFIGGIAPTNFTNGFKYTVLSHNTQLGAGRGGVLSAEYLIAKDYI